MHAPYDDFDFPVNLDGLSLDPDDLEEWAERLDLHDAAPQIGRRTRHLLIAYARARAEVMRACLIGAMGLARGCEQTCDQIYAQLPQRYRW